MEKRNSEQERGNNGRHGGVPYNRLAEDMAQPLADLQVPGVDNGSGETSENGRTENETETLPGPPEPRQGRHRGTPYQQLAADMAVPLAELQVPGASNVGETSSDGQVLSEMKDRRDVASVDQRETRRRRRNHYLAVAADMAGPLAEVRAPAISDERGSERPQSDHQSTESAPYQESLSEYNPDASCGSGYDSESCRHQSSTLLDARNERETEACQGEDMESVAVQESFSEYNEDASCGSGFYRSECSISDYQSSVQTSERESFNQRSFAADRDGFRSKSPSEIDTAQEKCHSQVDGEPFSKRTKPNPEATEEFSLPRSGLSYTESTFASDVQFESVPEVYPAESKLNESLPVQGSEKISTQNIEERAIEPLLTSEFEHMNLVDNNSVATGASFHSSAERSVPVSHSDQEVYAHEGNPELLKKGKDDYAVRKCKDSPVLGNDFASRSTNADSANVSTSVLSQGARPKTRPNVPREKKHKTPKQNTKNAYTELAKVVAGDLSAMNNQIDDSHAKTRRADDERKIVRRQELFDGSTVGAATSDAASLHAAPSEGEQRGTLQQPSLMDEDETRGNDVQDQGGNFPSEISRSRATSRRKLDAAAAAEHRSQVEEQQRLIDNMAPELQSMVIEMMRRDEEERGEHILLEMPLNPPVPPRTLPRGRGENVNQGACAEGALNQARGKKSRKGAKGKGHYVELAGLIAPELAAVNAAMVNGHTEKELAASGHKKTVGNQPGNAEASRGTTGSADEETLHPEPETSLMDRTGVRKTDTRSRDHWLSNGCAVTSSRNQSRTHVSLPPATIGRETTDGHGAFSMADSVRTLSQRRENGNRSGNRDYTGKGNRGKTGKQKKPRQEEKSKSNLLQMAEGMAESLQSLNARLEEQQRQQQSLNNHGAGARPEECVTRDTNGVWTNESCSSRKEDGHK